MEAAQIGVVRDSMLANPLLIRAYAPARARDLRATSHPASVNKVHGAEQRGPAPQMIGCRRHGKVSAEPALGKSRPRGLSFPGPDFVYGAVTTIRDGGVSEAISHWHAPSLPGSRSDAHSRRLEKDFVALNREGVKSGLVTAKEHYQYRATHDIRRHVPAKEGSRTAPPRIPDITFGTPTRFILCLTCSDRVRRREPLHPNLRPAGASLLPPLAARAAGQRPSRAGAKAQEGPVGAYTGDTDNHPEEDMPHR